MLIGHGVLITLVTLTLLKPFVALVFPNHLPGVHLVYYILPGLILQSMCEPIGLILNSAVVLKPMLAVNATNLTFNVVSIGLMITIGIFTLDHVAMLRSLSGIVMISGYVITFLCIRKRLYPVKTNTI